MNAVRAPAAELLHRAGAGDILGQIQIVSAGRLGRLGDQAGRVIGRGAQHGELACQQFPQGVALRDVGGDLARWPPRSPADPIAIVNDRPR